MIKIAIPTKGNVVDDHFGHCEKFTIFTFSDNLDIQKSEVLPSPQQCGCKSNIASVLKEMGVKVMLAGNMGNGAVNMLEGQNIKVFRGCSGEVRQLTLAFGDGSVKDSGENCHSHSGEENHQCNH